MFVYTGKYAACLISPVKKKLGIRFYEETGDFFREIGECFKHLGEDADCRVVVLSGAGKLFAAGEYIEF